MKGLSSKGILRLNFLERVSTERHNFAMKESIQRVLSSARKSFCAVSGGPTRSVDRKGGGGPRKSWGSRPWTSVEVAHGARKRDGRDAIVAATASDTISTMKRSAFPRLIGGECNAAWGHFPQRRTTAKHLISAALF